VWFQGEMRLFPAIPVWIVTAALLAPIQAQRRDIDTQRSVLTIHVYKAGVFSVFAHDHEIRAPINRGYIEPSENSAVEFWLDSGKLRVVDSEISAKDRAEVQKTMEGPDVLDVDKFPEIHFRSTSAQKSDGNRWIVRGEVELHGRTRPISVEVREMQESYA